MGRNRLSTIRVNRKFFNGVVDLGGASHACRVDQGVVVPTVGDIDRDAVARGSSFGIDHQAFLAQYLVDEGGFPRARHPLEKSNDLPRVEITRVKGSKPERQFRQFSSFSRRRRVRSFVRSFVE